jgi:hypothetical protein
VERTIPDAADFQPESDKLSARRAVGRFEEFLMLLEQCGALSWV